MTLARASTRHIVARTTPRGFPPALGWILVALWFAAIPALADSAAESPDASSTRRTPNGFQLDSARIPIEQILRGGPPRDGIPALDEPSHVEASASEWRDEQWVVGVVRGQAARAYPLAILVYHELVNDELGGDSILVSYCPLCGTALVFDRKISGEVHRFGVSGLLYRSDLLMFDRRSESLWSQISAEAVTGPMSGQRLTLLRSHIVPWGRWREEHPDTSVLSASTGHRRAYGRSPYGDYATSARLIFPVEVDRRRHPKLRTLGLRVPSGASRAYPGAEVARAGGRVEEQFAGGSVVVEYDEQTDIFGFEVPDGVEAIEGYWFAWMAFHPESSVYVAPEQ